MKIDLRWLNPNNGNTTEIYRSSEWFGEDLVGADLIATTDVGVNGYTDEDVTFIKVYYYRLKFLKKGYKPAISEIYEMQAVPVTGPGGSMFEFGDEAFGYFASIDTRVDTRVPTVAEICGIFGTATPPPGISEWYYYLHKFCIGGSFRYIFPGPTGAGFEVSKDNPIVANLLAGGSYRFVKGLHQWDLLMPSTLKSTISTGDTDHFPGELRSMLGVITDLYARAEETEYGNYEGRLLAAGSGQVSFYDMLTMRFESNNHPVNHIATCSGDETTMQAITWTDRVTLFPTKPKELLILPFEKTNENWEKTLIWPILVYSGVNDGV